MLMTFRHNYIHCNAADVMASVGLMCSAIDALSRWMASNRLLLNPSKTQFIWLGGRRQLAKVDLHMLADTTVCDLGLTLDQELSFSEHVNLITATISSVSYVLLCAPFPMMLLWSLCMPSSLAELITVAQSLLVSRWV